MTIWIRTDGGPYPLEDESFPGVINEEMPRDRFLGHQLENAVIRYGAIVEEYVARALSVSLFHDREDQAGKRKHAKAASPGPTTNARNWGIDPEVAGFRHFASDEREGPPGDLEQRRRCPPFGRKFFQRDTRTVFKAKNRAVDEADADPAVGSGLNDVALADSIANLDLNDDPVGTRKGTCAGNNLNFANNMRQIRPQAPKQSQPHLSPRPAWHQKT